MLRNLFNYKIVLPADPNQTDHIIRYITKEYGNFFVGMGRSATPIILNESGSPFFDDTYRFEYGKSDLLRNGTCATVIATGHMAAFAVLAWEKLQSKGCSIRVINVSCPSFVNTHTVTLAAETGIIITYEDHNMTTGLGSTIAQIIAENSIYVRLIKMGVMSYPPSGSPQDIYREQGLDVDSLVERIITEIHKKSTKEKE